MIGLKRKTVALKPYNKKWSVLFEVEKNRLEKILGNDVVDMQHIGSTSIPGLAAKPVIDIGVGLKTMKGAEKFIKILEQRGYFWRRIGGDQISIFCLPKATKKKEPTIFM